MLKITPVARKNDIVVQDLSNEILIYDLRANKALSLNETSTLVWQLANGKQTISEIAKNVTDKLNSPVSEEFVWLALWQLKKEKLLENGAKIPNDFAGATRREVIKKVGLTSLIALPFISSFVAPMAIHAQSGNCSAPPLALGCVCTTSPPCASACCQFPLGSPGICVPSATVGTGGVCIRSCECLTMCCNGTCATTGKAPSVGCGASCECTSLSCVGGVCT